jgi:hypothetical protein
MRAWLLVAAVMGMGVLACVPADATNLVTGNGFGFAVVSPETGTVTKFYAHPYSFMRPDAGKPLSEGVETANFIKSIGWGADGVALTAEYEQDSQVIRVRGGGGEGFVYMPFGLRSPALIVDWEAAAAGGQEGPQMEWSRPVLSRRLVRTARGVAELFRFDGIEESLLVIPLSEHGTVIQHGNGDLVGPGWVLVSLERGDTPEAAMREFERWRGGLSGRALVEREIAEVEKWRAKPAVHFADENERHLWRQSEVMLRMAQSREPNRAGRWGSGLMVASLPDGVWFTPWVRDMAWATVALAEMGHRAEARAALLAYFNARPTAKMRAQTAGADYQISVVRYWGNGAEEPFFTEEGSTNIEFDDWGEALWVVGEYLRKYDDPALLRTATYRGPLYASARDFVVKPLIANLEKFGGGEIVAADTSIWEERQKDKKHFAFSTAMAIVGLKEFADVARRAGDQRTRTEALRHVALLKKGFDAAFIRDGKLHGTLEEGVKNDIDGALLTVIQMGVVTDPQLVMGTVERMDLLKVASGGWRRVRSTYTDPAIFEYWYERQEFVFVDLSLAEVERGLGQNAEPEAIEKRITDKAAADHDILPEMYVAVPCTLFQGAIGDPTGARPMAGYGAGAYILDLLDRERPEKSR